MTSEIHLSDHFTLQELCKSTTAEIYHIDNTPNQEQIENLKTLCTKVLEPARQRLDIPFIINSGYRSAELNKAVGGVKNSYHLKGMAADIHADDRAQGAAIAASCLVSSYADQVILEKRGSKFWVHVQYSMAPRHMYIQDFK